MQTRKQEVYAYALFTFVIILSFRILWLSANLMRRHREAISCIVHLQCRFTQLYQTMHFYKHYLLRIFYYRNTGSSLCIDQSKPLLAERPRPLLTVFQKGFQLSIKKYIMPTGSILQSTACFYMALHCSTNLTSLRLHCYFQLFQQKYFLHPKTNLQSTQQHKNQVV